MSEWHRARAVSAMCQGPPSPHHHHHRNNNNNDYSKGAYYLCYCCAMMSATAAPDVSCAISGKPTNTNTFASVIDLYLPTFLTAFSSYWQCKHMGQSITFHLQSSLSLSLSPPIALPLSLSVSFAGSIARSLALPSALCALAICLNKLDNGTTRSSYHSFTPNFPWDNIIRPNTMAAIHP